MKNTKVLEMLNDGRINELAAMLQEEIFVESLNNKPSAKKRYTAMKKYLTYVDSVREILKRPCEVEIEGNKYTAFCNAYSLALTTESSGEIPLCEEPNRYPPVSKLLRYDGAEDKIDFGKVLAEAKSRGL